MKIPNLSLEITSDDILSLISKFTTDDSFFITSISMSDRLLIVGKVSLKTINIPFNCNLSLVSIANNIISIKIDSFNAVNITIPSKIKEAALKKILSSFSKDWINQQKDIITLDINTFMKGNKISTLSINEFAFRNSKLNISLENLTFEDSLESLLSSVTVTNQNNLMITI